MALVVSTRLAFRKDSNYCVGNERLQEMMGIMAAERGGMVFATDER